jgi:hypothetical protein
MNANLPTFKQLRYRSAPPALPAEAERAMQGMA